MPWTPAEQVWSDPALAVDRPARTYPWPLGRMRPVAGLRNRPGYVPTGHARAVWEHMDAMVTSAVEQRLLEPKAVDTDLEFLSLIGRHVVGCRGCVAPDPNGGGRTAQDILMTAAGAVPRLGKLVRVLGHDGQTMRR